MLDGRQSWIVLDNEADLLFEKLSHLFLSYIFLGNGTHFINCIKHIKGIFIAVIEKNLVQDTCSVNRNDSPSFDEITSIRSICILATPTG